jgi:uncharacterized protein (TIGR04141 family)
MAETPVRLTLYRYRPELRDIDDPRLCRTESTLETVGRGRVQHVDQEIRYYLVESSRRTPPWASFLDGHMPEEELDRLTVQTGILLLLRVHDWVVAVTSGLGHFLVNKELTEPDFGLRFAANSVDVDKVRALGTRSKQQWRRTQRTQVTGGGALGAFGLRPMTDWVRSLGGALRRDLGDLAPSVSGADAVSIAVRWDIRELYERCGIIMARRDADLYKEHFGFLDHYRELRSPRDTVLIRELDAALRRGLRARAPMLAGLVEPDSSVNELELVPPLELEDQAFGWRVDPSGSGRGYEINELTWSAVLSAVASSRPEALEQLRLAPVLEGGDTGAWTSLRDLLLCEVERDDGVYILLGGVWFHVQPEYRELLWAALDDLLEDEAELGDAVWGADQDEGEFCVEAARRLGGTVMHVDLIREEGGRQRTEVCDLIDGRGRLVYVKRWRHGESLCTLFRQARTFVARLAQDRGFREKVKERIDVRREGGGSVPPFDAREFDVVYAIGDDRGRALPGDFSYAVMQDLVSTIHEMRQHCPGIRVAVVRIPVRETPGNAHIGIRGTPAAPSPRPGHDPFPTAPRPRSRSRPGHVSR